MRYIKVIIWSLMVLMPSYALASDISEYNGHLWRNLSDETKGAIIGGFIMATSFTNSNTNFAGYVKQYDEAKASKLSELAILNKKNRFSSQEAMTIVEYHGRIANETMKSFEIINITNSQIVTGLDALFSDFKNMQIHVSDGIYLVKKQILGASDEELEALLQYVRGGKADYSKLYYQEKNGHKKWARFP